jgi:hypothetical protein
MAANLRGERGKSMSGDSGVNAGDSEHDTIRGPFTTVRPGIGVRITGVLQTAMSGPSTFFF